MNGNSAQAPQHVQMPGQSGSVPGRSQIMMPGRAPVQQVPRPNWQPTPRGVPGMVPQGPAWVPRGAPVQQGPTWVPRAPVQQGPTWVPRGVAPGQPVPGQPVPGQMTPGMIPQGTWTPRGAPRPMPGMMPARGPAPRPAPGQGPVPNQAPGVQGPVSSQVPSWNPRGQPQAPRGQPQPRPAQPQPRPAPAPTPVPQQAAPQTAGENAIEDHLLEKYNDHTFRMAGKKPSPRRKGIPITTSLVSVQWRATHPFSIYKYDLKVRVLVNGVEKRSSLNKEEMMTVMNNLRRDPTCMQTLKNVFWSDFKSLFYSRESISQTSFTVRVIYYFYYRYLLMIHARQR